MLTDRKIIGYADNIKALSDTPSRDGINAEALKAKFDGRTDKEVKTVVNGISDDLMATTNGASGADNIGIGTDTGLTGLTVKAQIKELKDGNVGANAPIIGATKCKVTYDAKGLVTSGADLTKSDLPTEALLSDNLIVAVTSNRTDKIVSEKALADYAISTGAGDMLKAVFDTTGKNQDIFAYADAKVSAVNNSLSKSISDISPTLTLTSAEVGKTYTCTDGTTTLTHTHTSGSTYKFILPNRGTWTVYDDTSSNSVNVENTSDYTIKLFDVFGVRIDTTNSNPLTAVTYTDDAIGMTAGSVDWDSKFPFNEIKPCVLKNGIVQYYLNPLDFTKKADGTASDITSGTAGDVMIEIPKGAYLIYIEGNYMYVKITNNPDAKSYDLRYGFYAFTRNAEGDKEKFYVGAYLGYSDGSKLRSLSGKTPTASLTIGQFRTLAQTNGTGYDLLSFYPLTFLQCCYTVRYKNLNSQIALGRGYVDGNSAAINTGGTNAKGMNFGETTGKLQMKFMGIEDFWGNLDYWIDGLYSNASRHILTAFKSFNDTGSGYTDRGQGATANLAGYLSKSQGTTTTGFIVKEANGSETTYYSDKVNLTDLSLPFFGGSWDYASEAGAFRMRILASNSFSTTYVGARLMYL